MQQQGLFFNLSLLVAILLMVINPGFNSAQAAEHSGPFGIIMVDIPAGSFTMGSCAMTDAQKEENKRRQFLGQDPIQLNCGTPDPDAKNNETPQRQVSISAFQMGKTPVTLGQFKQYIVASGRTRLITDDFMHYNNQGDAAPVERVSWNDAQAMVDWLNTHHGGGWGLPSEAEWEYAARAGTRTRFYTGNCITTAQANFDGRHPATGCPKGNLRERLVAADSFAPNAFGLHSMAGNVMEWTQDCWNNSHRGAPSDGSARTSGQCDFRVMRGGSWGSDGEDVRSAYRFKSHHAVRFIGSGFRLSRSH
ncbi:formylglycine-generating enzyme family protein [Marinospirillum perlucidum]|uniref:formylglycine-generating enzyme family protein n=1 Tax=Marinospirillum perlucidum TaxID=1982602 RepID=UPI00138FCA88|nr:SUMF1/EgtB/PvdO family nonheme iron enzyme [Marinospirillum perlucidum]